MDFTYPPEAEAFRAEIRAWLDEHLTDEIRAGGFGADGDLDGASLALGRQWNRLLADAGFAAIAWPPEWGGRGAGLHHIAEGLVFGRIERALHPCALQHGFLPRDHDALIWPAQTCVERLELSCWGGLPHQQTRRVLCPATERKTGCPSMP